MDHLHAVETHAAERYLLGELPAGQAEEFELHYFECQVCAGAVESGEMFIEGARAEWLAPVVTPTGQKAPEKPSFRDSLAVFWRRPVFGLGVAGALAVLVLYQNAVTIPDMHAILHTARPLPGMQLIGASRGEPAVVDVPAGSPFMALAADIPPGTPFREYVCVLSRGGREVSNSVSPAPSEGQPIDVLFPADQLKDGNHELTLYGRGADGGRADKIATFPFVVQFKQRQSR